MGNGLSAVVAGHLCLDIIPALVHIPQGEFSLLFQPGRLVEAGPAAFSTGGPVSNTGLALHRLGIQARLIGKIGDDLFGQAVLDLIRRYGPEMSTGIVLDPNASTSYTIIINAPGVDRIFLHHPGANDTFTARDIDYGLVAGVRLFHFGYPPIMRCMYQGGGQGLVEVLRRARATGATVSLDMAFPDPSSESGQADWRAIYRAALPHADIFLPSVEELLFMLRPEEYHRLQARTGGGTILPLITPELLADLSGELLGLGVKVAVIKLGENGLYLRTAGRAALESMGRAGPDPVESWIARQLWAPCFRVNVVGTTGAGDATIAGFLSALLRGLPPEEALTAAVGVGACNVEAADALSGIPPWEAVQRRIEAGWERLPLDLAHPGWRWESRLGIWVGPEDQGE